MQYRVAVEVRGTIEIDVQADDRAAAEAEAKRLVCFSIQGEPQSFTESKVIGAKARPEEVNVRLDLPGGPRVTLPAERLLRIDWPALGPKVVSDGRWAAAVRSLGPGWSWRSLETRKVLGEFPDDRVRMSAYLLQTPTFGAPAVYRLTGQGAEDRHVDGRFMALLNKHGLHPEAVNGSSERDPVFGVTETGRVVSVVMPAV